MSDRELAAYVDDLAARVPTVAPPLDRLLGAGRAASARRRRHRGVALVAGAAVAVAAVTLGPGLVVVQTPADVATSGETSPVPAPPGMKLVGIEGVAVAVPEAWSQGHEQVCGQAEVDSYYVAETEHLPAECPIPPNQIPEPFPHLVIVPPGTTNPEAGCDEIACPTRLELDGVAFDLYLSLDAGRAQLLEQVTGSLQRLPGGWTTVPHWPLEVIRPDPNSVIGRPMSRPDYEAALDASGLGEIVTIVNEQRRLTSPPQGSVVRVPG